MNLKDILDKVLALGSNVTIKEGKEIYKEKLVSNLSSKNISGIYHIYSKVNSKKEYYSCHIKIDLNKEKVIGCTCTCKQYEDFSKYKSDYICKHIVASTFTFYSAVKKKINKNNINVKERKNVPLKEKIKLKLDIDIKEATDLHKISPNERKYYIQLRIGETSTYLIGKLKEFFKHKNENKSLRINGEFLFNPYAMSFNSNDEELLYFIYQNLAINNSVNNYNKVNLRNSIEIYEDRFLVVKDDVLRSILMLINRDKKIKLNYDYINYESYVFNEDLNLTFTLKLEKDTVVLTTKKKLPVPLSKNFDIFLNERNIYLPSDTQSKHYKKLWEELKKNGKILYKKDSREILNLLKVLKNISNDISLGEGVKRFCIELFNIKLYFGFENSQITCKASIDYLGDTINILDKNNEIFLRNFELEDYIERRLERLRFIKKNDKFIFIGNDDELFELLSVGIPSLSKFAKVVFSNNFNEVSLIGEECISSSLEEEDDKFYFKYAIEGLEFYEYKNILNAMNEGKNYYKTKKGKLLNLRDLGIKNFFNMIDNLNADSELLNGLLEVDKNKALFLENNITNSNLTFIRGSEILKKVTNKISNRINDQLNQPEGLNGTLRNYQLVGFNFLKSLSYMEFGGILADEMGLGKTIQVISFLLSETNKKSLIITPTSLIYNWKEEFIRFAPNMKIGIVHGSKSARQKVLANKDLYDVLITTYGTIKNDIDFYKSNIFDYCIIDEAQNIKNPKSQNTKTIKSINAKTKIALTGTPIENNLLELWSIFDFIMPGYLFNEKKFKEKYINNDENIDELKELIKPFILRRLKKDVLLEIPDKIEKKYFVPMTLAQKVAYKNYMKEIKNNIKNKNTDKFTILSYLTRLRQLCQDPYLIDNNYLGDNGKLPIACEIINDAIKNNNKILVFSQFTSVLKRLRNKLELDNINTMYLDGATNAKERINLVENFNNSDESLVFLISLKAGGTGLNLTSAKIVIHMDPWWNPAIEDQATDRAHRIGQKNIVEVIKLISKDTIEEKIIQLQEEKREIINDVLNDDVTNTKLISKLTNDEILELFE